MITDLFNVQAIHTLTEILHRWIEEHNQVYNGFIKLKLPIRTGKPKFPLSDNYVFFVLFSLVVRASNLNVL